MKRESARHIWLAAMAAAWMSSSCNAMTTEYRTYDNGFTIELNFYDADDWNMDGVYSYYHTGKHFNLTENMKNAIREAVDCWGDLLGKGAKAIQPVQFFIRTEDDVDDYGSAVASIFSNTTKEAFYIVDQITKGKELLPYNDSDPYKFFENSGDTDPMAFGVITITKKRTSIDATTDYEWDTGKLHTFTADTGNNGLQSNLTTTVIHELGHVFGFNRDIRYMTEHTFDYYGNSYLRDKPVVSSAEYKKLTGKDPEQNDTYLILDSLADAYTDEEEYYEFCAHPETYFLYFTGEHVTEVLDGARFLGKPNAIPIMGLETSIIDGSHCMIDSMLSHRWWRTYSLPIEADLAMLQDIGYDIDRRAYFGYSLYDSHRTETVETGYSARNDAGTAYTGEYSDVSYGVGLHIYGSENTVTQKGNILTKGDAATGILVSGVRNIVTVDEGTEIHADGDYGVGIQAAYGRNHVFNLDGTITADGENGIGAKFDLGTGAMGYEYGICGSYIKAKVVKGRVDLGENGVIFLDNPGNWYFGDYVSEVEELLGPLAETVNVNGTLLGKSNAIYISPNAFVENININDGAEVSGNMTSDWKHFEDLENFLASMNGGNSAGKVGVWWNDAYYATSRYIPDLVTNLNFKGNHTYGGNITGTDNMKINVSGGVTHFSGTADVVNVTVKEDGELYGGTYIVNDMSNIIASTATDDTTGTLYNYGKFGTDGEGENVIVIGNLESASGSTLVSAADEETAGTIRVYGKAKLAADVKAGGTQGEDGVVLQSYDTLQIGDAEEISTSAMRIASGVNENGIIVGARLFGDNVGEKDALQQETFDAVEHIDSHYESEEDLPEELQTLENMTPAAAKNALMKIGSNEAAALAFGRVQQKNIVGNRITSRMKDAWATDTQNISHENNLWVKTGKSWGDLDKATLGSSDIMFGYDRTNEKDRIDGFFVSYSDENMSENSDRAELYDTRIGYYSGRRMGPAIGTFFADIGYVRGKTERNLGIGSMTAEGKPRTWFIETGYEYKYDLKHGTNAAWNTSPYGKIRVSFARHKGYTETGAGVFNQDIHEKNHFYGDAEIGVDVRRSTAKGNFGFTCGLRQVFAGLDSDFTFNYIGAPGYTHSREAYQDKNRFLIGADGNIALGRDWHISGEARYEKGAHSRELWGAVSLEYRF